VRLLPSRHDTTAGLVLGVQSVPDGLATGLLAGLNPSAGLYGYMIGTAGGALFTSSAFMAVQGTGAMAIVIDDVPGLSGDDASRALVTLALLTGAVMLVAGLLRLGSILRFVSNAVMVGFISAVGVNIVLGQLANLTGYGAEGANRVVRAARTLVRPDRWSAATVLVGLTTIALIVLLGRTRLGAMGLVVAGTKGSVVILRLRGRTDLGTTFMDVLHRYASALASADSQLVLASVSERTTTHRPGSNHDADAARSRRRRMSGRFDIRCTTAGSASSPAV
jgi:MFS superfamily sulfate permease-like transporter